MKKLVTLLLLVISLGATAQLKDKIKLPSKSEEGEDKKQKMGMGERFSKAVGNLMTGKTDELDNCIAMISYVCGFYPPEIGTTESKFLPPYAREGDWFAGVSFLKNEGAGVLQIQGAVTANRDTMEYLGLGSYAMHYFLPQFSPVTLDIMTESGDEASFMLHPMGGIELVSVNGENSLPIIDLAEDLVIEYVNPPGTEGTRVKLSLLTQVMGVTALNHFADFDAGKEGKIKLTIPKESLANPEIAGAVGMGQYNKGENFLIIERERKTQATELRKTDKLGDLASAEITTRAYSSMPVVVKGKQDGGLMTGITIRNKTPDGNLRWNFNKPNAQTGIPFSKGSKFGLVSFTVSAVTFQEETNTYRSSYTSGGIEYTRTTTVTKTLEFPQLPDSYWEYVLDAIYKDLTQFFKSEFNIDFVPVDQVTGTSQYNTLFTVNGSNEKKGVKMAYKGTSRTDPATLREAFSGISTNVTADNPKVNMMKEAGDLDGLVSMNLNLGIATNEKDNIILIPTFNISITGRDESNNDKQGVYLNGNIVSHTGQPFNGDQVKSSKQALLKACSYDQIQFALKHGVNGIKLKEVELGYDRMWSIGQESTEEEE